MAEHPSKHDTFLRTIMGNRQIALDYFHACLPPNVLEKLDFSTLRQLPDTYVSKELQKSISDIVYACKRAGGVGEIKISLLIEHKSYVDKYTPIQIGSYIFSGLLKQIADREKPSLIIPILLYHGKAQWEYKTLSSLFDGLEPEFSRFVPDYHYVFNNLGAIPDEQIQELHNKFLAASLLAMKHSVLKDSLTDVIPTILKLAGEIDKNLQTSLIVYTFVNSELSEQQIIELTTSLPTQIRATVMSTLDVFVEKGRKQKTENAVRNLIKQSLLTDEQIASALEVTVKYVADIRRQGTEA
ncbi:DNA-binding transcriptional regulator YhcF (GntR family) [Dyadobacter sp. BE34]|uniref:DNA-binding transcriptional regulator YhcF (GntR family) n=1 Tax=Dyadobacter fermentans TaxID=94254 RepID=A0ABU1R8K2_9BACT|nr:MULTISPECIES: Rpn family recombination-promoting nuclease/putative transposase [Dyadobacter]MDR6809741.1 DNA-binding transcriptional regulator YhcF (GntR family) [Dyadobacter fermentans]MDR7047437.1 DNA-binding transcriptional regulator YhcF (GntR family) [Dyadobacter sp. BE242]MDR7201606.1 DNA-binding transcriptional regulator YhcF (GntR family) [Dyadobacter sp. BE34]MDR7219476.1 DNA-binding transcriptional regulator YhcF (GntR family) [Dyadobacter sp. BE31]MDR7267243.1 DNA-binding transcr